VEIGPVHPKQEKVEGLENAARRMCERILSTQSESIISSQFGQAVFAEKA
jgi:hypothetical protein